MPLLAALVAAAVAAGPVVTVDGALAGEVAAVRVHGGTPGARVIVVVSGARGRTCRGAFRPPCFDLRGARFVAWGTLDASGAADFAPTVTAAGAGRYLVQAGTWGVGPTRVSPVVAVPVGVRGADTDGDGALDEIEVERGLDPLVPDTDGDGQSDAVDPDPLTPGAPDPFVPDARPLTPAGVVAVDPEVDPLGPRLAWQTLDGAAVWTTGFDPVTGALDVPDGRQHLAARNVTPFLDSENGPEWVVYDGRSDLVLTRPDGPGAWRLVGARWSGTAWQPVAFTPTVPALAAVAASRSDDPVPAVAYRTAWDDTAVTGWAVLDGLGTGRVLGGAEVGGRYVPDADRFVLSRRAADGAVELVWLELATGVEEIVARFDADAGVRLDRPNGLLDPVDGTPLVLAELVVDAGPARALATWRRGPAGWEQADTVRPPAGLPHVYVSDVFVWDGRPWAVFIGRQAPSWRAASAVFVAALDGGGEMRRLSPDPLGTFQGAEVFLGGPSPLVFGVSTGGGMAGRLTRLATGL